MPLLLPGSRLSAQAPILISECQWVVVVSGGILGETYTKGSLTLTTKTGPALLSLGEEM